MKSYSILIVSFNGAELLKKHLPSVIKALEFAGGVGEVIIGDNGSTDNTPELLKKFPQVKVQRFARNLGFIAATNALAALARGEIIITLNNDMDVAADFLPPLLAPFNEADVFAVTPKVYYADGRSLNAGLKYGFLSGGWFKEVLETDEAKLTRARLTLYAHGGSGAFDKKKFLSLGGFDEIYAPFYQEALDLSYRAYKMGWRVLFEPQSVAYHQHRSTVNRLYSAAQIDRVLLRNQLLFYWINISDVDSFTEHLRYLAQKLWSALREGDEIFLSAYLMALMNLRQVSSRQRQRSELWVKTDQAVLDMING